MQPKKASTFIFTIIALIVGVALYKQVDFANATVKKPGLATVYLVTFLFSVYVIIPAAR